MIGCFNRLITLYRMISEKKASNAPITFEEIVMFIIKYSNRTLLASCLLLDSLHAIGQFMRLIHA